jgi:hypothetical protein
MTRDLVIAALVGLALFGLWIIDPSPPRIPVASHQPWAPR